MAIDPGFLKFLQEKAQQRPVELQLELPMPEPLPAPEPDDEPRGIIEIDLYGEADDC